MGTVKYAHASSTKYRPPNRCLQVFRFASSKNASLFLQRKNPRKIAWTQVYRRMHKKGITEEVAKKRSRRTVKHQRGIVGADLATIAARRNQTAAVRSQARLAAITKAKTEKKEKENKKAKVCVYQILVHFLSLISFPACFAPKWCIWTKGIQTTDEGWKGWTIKDLVLVDYSPLYALTLMMSSRFPLHMLNMRLSPLNRTTTQVSSFYLSSSHTIPVHVLLGSTMVVNCN